MCCHEITPSCYGCTCTSFSRTLSSVDAPFGTVRLLLPERLRHKKDTKANRLITLTAYSDNFHLKIQTAATNTNSAVTAT